MTVLAVLVAAVIAEGSFGVYSPDGKRIAYQADRGGLTEIAVKDLASGAVTWVSEGPGEGLYPAWGRDGAVIYTYGRETGTAYGNRKERRKGGYNLFRWKNGKSHRLTQGRSRDYLASVSPDGSVLYTTTKGMETSLPAQMIRDKLVRRVKGGATEDVRVPMQANGGVHSASVSPDGKTLVWAEVRMLRDIWRICAASLDRVATTQPCFLTPDDSPSYAPRWSPDGKSICYTACKEGDPGWCVYVQDLATGDEYRICEGRHPAFSPDGKRLLYDREGELHEIGWTRGDGRRFAGCSAKADANFTHYRVDVTVKPGTDYGNSRHDVVANALPVFSVRGTGGDNQKLVFSLRNGRPMFRSEDKGGAGANTFMSEPSPQGTNFTFTCVRGDHTLSIYRNGRLEATRWYPAGLVPIEGSAEPVLERSDALVTANLSFGKGVPDDLEKPLVRTELFGGIK